MTEYRVIEARKRSFIINAEMPDRAVDSITVENPILWDDLTEILWDDDTEILWDTGTTAYAMEIPARKRSFVINAEVNNG